MEDQIQMWPFKVVSGAVGDESRDEFVKKPSNSHKIGIAIGQQALIALWTKTGKGKECL